MNSRIPRTESTNILILGAGLTGLSVAYHLREECLVVESSDQPGGTAGSISIDGFHLDRGVHILYFRDPWTLKFISDQLGVPLVKKDRQAVVWFRDRLIPYPIQFNLSSIPFRPRLKIGASCLRAICRSSIFLPEEIHDLESWAVRNFGDRLSEEFFTSYNEKLFGLPPHELTTDWMEGYVPRPDARNILSGMMSGFFSQYGPNSTFWYPATGGISTVSDALAKRVKAIRYGMNPEWIDLDKKIVRFLNGDTITYRRLINTIPLTELASLLTKAEPGVIQAARNLRSNALTIGHVLIPRPGVGGGRHWIYVPQPEIPFYRITLTHNIGPSTCPEGWSVLTLEIGGRVKDKTTLESACKSALTSMALLLPKEETAKVHWDEVAHGYVMYDRKLAANRHNILKKLREHDVICVGRYGRWEYSNMESALLQGRDIRRRIGVHEHRQARRKETNSTGSASMVSDYFAKHYPKRRSRLARLLFRRGEPERLAFVRALVPYTEGMRILDAGCGDGSFLSRALHGSPSSIHLEDLVPEQLEIAYQQLLYKTDTITTGVCDSKSHTDADGYDLILALGISDYEPDWQALVAGLSARCRGELIIDFPKTGTLQGLVRRIWLRRHHLRLHAASKSEIEETLRACRVDGAISELRLQWLVRIRTRDAVDGNCN